MGTLSNSASWSSLIFSSSTHYLRCLNLSCSLIDKLVPFTWAYALNWKVDVEASSGLPVYTSLFLTSHGYPFNSKSVISSISTSKSFMYSVSMRFEYF